MLLLLLRRMMRRIIKWVKWRNLLGNSVIDGGLI
jgi:hypothetical protein